MKHDQMVGSPPVSTPADLVHRIMREDPEAEAQLYHIFSTGVRFLMMRRLRNSSMLEDELHTSFIITIQAIRSGMLREPERLMGFVRTVVSRRIAELIDGEVFRRNHTVSAREQVIRDKRLSADQMLIERQKLEIAREILQEMSASDREVLVRFYLEEQTPERICREMNLTGTQYRLLKHRAKIKFAERGQRKLAVRRWNPRMLPPPAPTALLRQPSA
jgi:RNA polymerase sigma-70 factor (ECF subfamily)